VGDTGGVRVLPLLLAALLLGGLTGCGENSKAVVKPAYHGVEPQNDVRRPAFVLQDTEGKPFDFLANTKGRPTFVYFGYTNCPDECPTAMADIATALRKSAPELQAKTRVVFVTTDPKRDTAPVLRRWLDQFSTEFVGLLGTQAQVDAAQRAAGVQPATPEGPVPTIAGRPDQHLHKEGTAPHEHFGPLGYSVAHSAVIFAYNAADRLPVVYPGGVTPSDIAADLPVLARP
jgi:cytochrome oxidase Cu insertion factor (SCO1/SenC/PrrC family)